MTKISVKNLNAKCVYYMRGISAASRAKGSEPPYMATARSVSYRFIRNMAIERKEESPCIFCSSTMRRKSPI